MFEEAGMIKGIVLLCTGLTNLCIANVPPEVNTGYGLLQGTYMTSRDGRVFSAFLGIPYAAPPVGELRFRPPQQPLRWQGVRRATQEGNICSQGKYGGSEDCLFVNVFTPSLQGEPQLPVMFYIHGGSFYMGSPSLGITGPEYFMDKNVVLVTVRYRLGPFGFLSTGDSVIPGNIGLKDQVKALQWVHENIQHFGGNPLQVTLFGCSAGGSSVHLHLQSLQSQKFFVRGISQSGTASASFALIKKRSSKESTIELIKYLNCSTNSSEIVPCLQMKTAAEIEDAHTYLQNLGYRITKSIFRPVIESNNEDAFLTSNPLMTPTYKPWLTGITSNEGILHIRKKYLNETIKHIKTEFNVFGPKALLFHDICSMPNRIANCIHEFYFKNSSTQEEMVKSMEEMFTDWWHLWPLHKSSKLHQGILYQYVYNHRGEFSYTDVYDSPKYPGVSHLDDLISLFRHSQYFPILNEQDTKISKLLVDLWVNFATSGDPTPVHISSNPLNKYLPGDFKWVPYTRSNHVYLNLKTDKLSMQTGIYPSRLSFWETLNVIDKYP